MSTSKLKCDIYSQTGEKVKQVDLNPAIFGLKINEGLVHQAVQAQLANRRQVLAHTKDRSEVHGGGRKPWRQKGTGRARHGSIRSPLWVGGGVTFGPTKIRNFAKKINKKMKRKALFMCLTDRAKDKNLILLDKLEIKHNKTREFIELLKNLQSAFKSEPIRKNKLKAAGREKAEQKSQGDKAKTDQAKESGKFDIKDYKTSILVVVGKDTAKISRSARNIVGLKILGANSLNVVDILAHKNLLMTQDSLKIIEEMYLKT